MRNKIAIGAMYMFEHIYHSMSVLNPQTLDDMLIIAKETSEELEDERFLEAFEALYTILKRGR